jgi:hypothetical protein
VSGTDVPISGFEGLFGNSNNSVERDALVAAAREELRRRLPELRKLPGFPNGSDEDILAMSYPPYYTACPNPFIADWLESLDRPSDEDRVDPGPFASDVSEGKGNPFYKAHSYPTKVPHPAIMRFILHYTKPGDIVLDGFAGSGMTGVAAQACGNPDPKTKAAIEAELGRDNIQWGARRAILGDLGPAATFIEAGLNLPIDAAKFDAASRALLDRFEEEFGWMYRTTVVLEGEDPFEAEVSYTVWSEFFTCPHCGGEINFFKAALDERSGRVLNDFNCPSCNASLTKDSCERRLISIRTPAGDIQERVDLRPVMISWRRGKRAGEKVVDDGDLAVLAKIARLRLEGLPTSELPLAQMVHGSRLKPKGLTHVHHMWNDRSLAAIAAMWGMTSDEDDGLTRLALRFWIEQAFLSLSWMNGFRRAAFSMNSQYPKGFYYVGSMHAEPSILYNLVGTQQARGKQEALRKLWSAGAFSLGDCMITTSSSTRLHLPDATVDYVFVDPPFGQNIPYADLMHLNESWHKVLTAFDEEATQDPIKGRGLDEYAALMTRCFVEFFRVLKPGRWMTVEFSNHSNEVWLRIQNALASAGFVVADTRVIDKEQLSYRQITADNAVKHDLVISAYKPAVATEQSFEIAAGSADGAWAFVREHLSRIPATEGSKGQALVVRERQADRVYERMVGYHVARNTLVPMTAAEFYAGLEQRFPVRDGMYFLPGQVEEYERFRITFKDLAVQELFIRDESTAVQWLRQTLKDRPRAFADIQPLFMREMQSSVASWEEMPDLREMLEGNFVSDDKGRWSVPDPKKAEDLDQLRTRALLREFDGYKDGRGPLTRFRTEAVRAGFKAAWAAKDYATITTVGRRLPSDVFIEDSALLHYFRNAERLAP